MLRTGPECAFIALTDQDERKKPKARNANLAGKTPKPSWGVTKRETTKGEREKISLEKTLNCQITSVREKAPAATVLTTEVTSFLSYADSFRSKSGMAG